MMPPLQRFIGHEHPLSDVTRALREWADPLEPAAVGALHVTCSDETERECAAAFQQEVVDPLLPPLKPHRRAAFQISNLGGRYERGAAGLVEDHFAPTNVGDGYTLLIGKVNAHVACEPTLTGADRDRAFRLGVWSRYGRDSSTCGALHAVLAGRRSPALDDLREAFTAEGVPRLDVLNDPGRVDPAVRPLAAAIVSAGRQADTCVRDIKQRPPASRCLWIVLACVTINRHEDDTEVLCGWHLVDGRHGPPSATYVGLGDDPAALHIDRRDGRFVIER